MHLAAVNVNVRAEDGRITRNHRGVAGESQARFMLTDLLPGDAVEIEFFLRDMMQQDPEEAANDVASEALEDAEAAENASRSTEAQESEEPENVINPGKPTHLYAIVTRVV